MTDEHPLPPTDDPRWRERELAYEGEERAREDVGEDFELHPSEVGAFVATVLVAAGWSTDPPVVVHFDVPDESELSGWADSAGLHFHPRLCSRWVVLHELAHAIDPRDGHAATFRQRYAELVDHGIGRHAGDELRRQWVLAAITEFERLAADGHP